MPPTAGTAPAATSDLEVVGPEARLSSRLRPGVAFPDWSVVTSASARAALAAMLEAAWNRRAWRDYAPAEDVVRRAILELYRDLGRAPSPDEIGRRTDTAPDRVRRLLKRLAARDLIVLECDRITGAYPLTDRLGEHGVHLGGRTLHAMCAIDALGVGAMYRTDATIRSRCRLCHAPIDIATDDAGRRLGAVAPSEAVVLAGIGYRGGCAATSLCTTIAFFCSDVHLSAWRSGRPVDATAFRLSIDEALQTGRAIFGPVLAPSALEVRPETAS